MVTRRKVVERVKRSGLKLQSDAVNLLVKVVSQEDDEERALAAVLEGLKEQMRAQGTQVASAETLEAVIAELSKDDSEEDCIQLLNATETPRLEYDPSTKQFQLTKVSGGFHAGPQSKIQMFRDRYLLVRQRLEKHPYFRKPLVISQRGYIQLSTIDTLMGGSGENRWLIGMVTEGAEEGVYLIEDLNASVPLDLSQATVPNDSDRFITEGSIVLVEGRMDDGKFAVKTIGFPPPEKRTDSLSMLSTCGGGAGAGMFDIFGTSHSLEQWKELQEKELESEETSFVVVSDLHLDKPMVLEKVRTMMEGYSEMEKLPVFIFIGNFTSRPVLGGTGGIHQLEEYFRSLSSVLEEFPRMCEEGHFVFVPGPSDPGAGNTLPHPPISSRFAKSLQSTLSHSTFATNPCRLRFYAQEIVIFREDILKKMQRHSLFAKSTPEPTLTLVKSIVDQNHLCALPLTSRPIHWQFDHSLRLYPLPDVLILADRTDQYEHSYADCHAVNPGSFPMDFSFLVYNPATGSADFSAVP